MGRKKPTSYDEDNGLAVAGAVGKAKKKAFVVADDEYSIGSEPLDEALVPEDKVAPLGNKKKGKKGATKKILKDDDDDLEGLEAVEEDGDDTSSLTNFSGKKKSKGKSSARASVFATSNFGLLGDDEEDKEDDYRDDINHKADEYEEDLNTSLVEFSGKKEPSKSKNKKSEIKSSAFDLLEPEENADNNLKDESSKEDDEDFKVSFTGKKKKKLKNSSRSSSIVARLDKENDEDASLVKIGNDFDEGADVDIKEDATEISFTGKKKSSQKKSIAQETTMPNRNGDNPTEIIEPDQQVDNSEVQRKNTDPVENLKNKKKKKKGAKADQEEEDLDKILAELGIASGVPKDLSEPIDASGVTHLEKMEADQSEPEEASFEKNVDEEGPVESAAAKKKKKKKEKEKEKKAAASAPEVEEEVVKGKPEAVNKVSNKKIPKLVREMQEKLAKLKEAEERKKREEEEKLRKEEEERLRQEELERLAEERKRLKKEREKEKIQKKKQEGTYLTQKEKLEARRREIARNQLIANSGILNVVTGEPIGMPAKRPIYQNKKSKPTGQPYGTATLDGAEIEDSKDIQQETQLDSESIESENANDSESLSAKDNNDNAALVEQTEVHNEEEEEEEEDDDDDDWDAKSWDSADLKFTEKSAFADEEIDTEPQPLLKKEYLNTKAPAQDEMPSTANKHTGLNGKASIPQIPEHADVKKKDLNIIADNTNKAGLDKKSPKEVLPKEETAKSDSHNLRSPICCIMGHVDTGKTKLLDCIRGTNVQEGEAGGITQQIGATYFPAENIREKTRELKADAKLNVPGLLVIDTPGHESFTNLRSRGSGLCDIAILVVDIMHGLEPQTIESLNLLKMRETEFIVALNKLDRLYGWKTCRNAPIMKAMKQQSKDVQIEFNTRLTGVITQLKEQGLNTELYYKNKDMGETYNIVPTSAISGEGVPDLLLLLVQWAQKTMISRLTYKVEVQCTVLEVKVVEGHGTTIDVVLVNGVLREGDQIVVCGFQEPIVTNIRALLTPHPMKELRVKGTYLHHKEIKAAQGIKISAQGLEHAVAGTSLYVVGPGDDLEDIKESAMEDMKSVMSRIDKSGEGVYVQASSLGSLEALLEFLKSPAVKIPVSGISVGPVHKKDVMKASVMVEKKKEYATILAFDVKVTQEARELADERDVKIFTADIIYHLFDQFKAHMDRLKEEKKKQAASEAVFPCILKIVPGCVFNKKDPIVLGVDVLEGVLKIGTPLCVPQKDFVDIGSIASIENNHKPVDSAKKGEKVAIKVVSSNPEEQKIFGRHFEIEDELFSKISRSSLDAIKENYSRTDLSDEEWKLLFKLKKLFKIP